MWFFCTREFVHNIFEGYERFGESLSLPCFCQVKKRPLGHTVSASQKKTEATGRKGTRCGVGLQKEETEVLWFSLIGVFFPQEGEPPGFQQSWRRFGSEDEFNWLSQRCSLERCRWMRWGPEAGYEGRGMSAASPLCHTMYLAISFHSDLLLWGILNMLNKKNRDKIPSPEAPGKQCPKCPKPAPSHGGVGGRAHSKAVWIWQIRITKCKQQRSRNVQAKPQAGISFELGLPHHISIWKLLAQHKASRLWYQSCGLEVKLSFPVPQQGELPDLQRQQQPPCPSAGLRSPQHKPASGSALAKLFCSTSDSTSLPFIFTSVLYADLLKDSKKKELNQERSGLVVHITQ